MVQELGPLQICSLWHHIPASSYQCSGKRSTSNTMGALSVQMRRVNHGSQLLIVTGTAFPSTVTLTTPGIIYLGRSNRHRCMGQIYSQMRLCLLFPHSQRRRRSPLPTCARALPGLSSQHFKTLNYPPAMPDSCSVVHSRFLTDRQHEAPGKRVLLSRLCVSLQGVKKATVQPLSLSLALLCFAQGLERRASLSLSRSLSLSTGRKEGSSVQATARERTPAAPQENFPPRLGCSKELQKKCPLPRTTRGYCDTMP